MTTRDVSGRGGRAAPRRAAPAEGATPPGSFEHLVSVPVRTTPLAAANVSGTDIEGRPVSVRLVTPGAWTLLLFLSSHCDGCAPFWRAVQDAPSLGLDEGDAAIVVTHDLEREDRPAIARALAPSGPGPSGPAGPTAIVMSSGAWRTYGVHGPPFFVLVDGEMVATEGVAWSIAQVRADVGRARRPSAR